MKSSAMPRRHVLEERSGMYILRMDGLRRAGGRRDVDFCRPYTGALRTLDTSCKLQRPPRIEWLIFINSATDAVMRRSIRLRTSCGGRERSHLRFGIRAGVDLEFVTTSLSVPHLSHLIPSTSMVQKCKGNLPPLYLSVEDSWVMARYMTMLG